MKTRGGRRRGGMEWMRRRELGGTICGGEVERRGGKNRG